MTSLKSRFLKRNARVHRALAAATDQYDGPIDAGDFLHLADKMRIDGPVGPVVPRDMMGARGMPDEQVFHFAAAVDEERLGILMQEIVRVLGFRCFMGDR